MSCGAVISSVMLHINDLSYRIAGKLILDKATAAIPAGHKVGMVGRNGAGKTTLLKLIAGSIAADDGGISMPRNTSIGQMAQEAPGGPETLLETVLAADEERRRLLSEAETERDGERLAIIHERLIDIDAHTAPSRAARILAGLGFDDVAQARPCSEFSGGWRMRVALAAVLFTEPDLLLLDEPSNYLDLEGTLWLESYLKAYPRTVLIVSHDRDLLNKAVTSILHLTQGRLSLYAGGYDRFEETLRERQRLDLKLKKKQDDQRRHMEVFVERFRAKATKAKQAQSRIKALARLQPIAEQIAERVTPLSFPNPKKSLGDPMIRLEDASVGYAPGVPVLRDLNLRLDSDDRIGLLGANGNGKSTIAQLISGRMAPMSGRRLASDKLAVGYFAQHQMDELPEDLSPYDHIRELMGDATEAQRRTRLGSLGFGADKADTKAKNLSGGEKARLLFARAAFHGPHLLILDEPSNHLDVDSREALVRALAEYEGAVILISHDRHLIEASVDRLWIVRDGTVVAYDGDMDSYRTECLAERGGYGRRSTVQHTAAAAGNGLAPTPATGRDGRRQSAAARAELAPLRAKMKNAERAVAKLQAGIGKLDALLADANIYARDPKQAQAHARERGQLAKALADTEEAWLAASEAFEQAQGA